MANLLYVPGIFGNFWAGMAFEAGGSGLVYLIAACVLSVNLVVLWVFKGYFEFELGKGSVLF